MSAIGLLAVAGVTAGAPATARASARCGSGVIGVAVFRGGDDGLTNRTAEAIEAAFGANRAYALVATAEDIQPDTLLVELPTHVAWRGEEPRGRVATDIVFKVQRGDVLGRTRVSCREGALDVCGRAAVKASRRPVCDLLKRQLELIAFPAKPPPAPPSR